MSITISAKNDYSYLFSGMFSNNSVGMNSLSGLLADYTSIKNGSYGKLMKAYYAKDNESVSKIVDSSSQNKSKSKDDSKTIAAIESSSAALHSSIEALQKTGSKSLFNKETVTKTDENGVEITTEEYNTDAIYKAVNSFVSDYNKMLEEGSDSHNSKILNSLKNMISATDANEKMLASVGITIESDDTLSVDETAFKNADMARVKTIFNGIGSYGYSISTKASFINMYAASDAKSASGLYGSSASYLSPYNMGNIYSSFV